MSVAFSNAHTQRQCTWTQFKSFLSLRVAPVQWDYNIDLSAYYIWFYDGVEIFVCTIWLGSVPDSLICGYPQAQNDADKTDWEANYKPTSNASVEPKAIDGRLSVCTTIAKRTKNFKLRTAYFYTSKAASVVSDSPLTDASYGDMTLSLTKWDTGTSSWISATDIDAERTVVDWDALYPFEILGGWADIPPSLYGGTTDAWHISGVGLPDYAFYGLAIDFVNKTNIEAITGSRVTSDGVATQYMSPTIVAGVNHHTNRVRWIIEHPAAEQKRFQVYLRTFV